MCHLMEVVDEVADHFKLINDDNNEDVLAAVVLLARDICEHYPDLLCSRFTPAPIRDLGMPYYKVDQKEIMMRKGYTSFAVAACAASKLEVPPSSLHTVVAVFHQVYQTTNVYLTNLQRCGFRPKVILDCGAHEGQWARQMKKYRFPESLLFMVIAQYLHYLCKPVPDVMSHHS